MSETAGAFTPPDIGRVPFDQLAQWRGLLSGSDWPTLDALNAVLATAVPRGDEPPLRFVAQTQALLRDGLHFERRIRQRGEIATRPGSWHDLFSALAWFGYPRLKLAMNALQCEDIGRAADGNRTRRQQALAHVDEAGLLVASEDRAHLDAIDAHDWEWLFWKRREDFGRTIVVHVFGHALFELLREPHLTLAGKALLMQAPRGFCAQVFGARRRRLDATAAAAVTDGRLAADPADMPSLPLAGVPDVRSGAGTLDFIRGAPCFRPRPAGRHYAAPVSIGPL